MGHVMSKRKKKRREKEVAIRSDTLESSDEFREAVYQNPTDLRVLNAAIREADELRKNEEIEKAVVCLRNAFDKALDKLKEVPANEYEDAVVILQVMKECINQWKDKNTTYIPNFRRLRHLKLDDIDNNNNNNTSNRVALDEKSEIPLAPPRYGDVAENQAEYPLDHKEVAKEVENHRRPEIPNDNEVKKYGVIDDSQIQTNVSPFAIDPSPLFPHHSFTHDPVSVDTLYLSLRRADQERTQGNFSEASLICAKAFDNCIYNMERLRSKERVNNLSLLLRLLRDCQTRWEREEDYSPNYDGLSHIKLPVFDEQNEI